MFSLDWSVGDVLLVLFALQLGAAAVIAGTMVVGSAALAATAEAEKQKPIDAFEALLAEKATVVAATETVAPEKEGAKARYEVSDLPAVLRRKHGVTDLASSHEARKAWREANLAIDTQAVRKRSNRRKVGPVVASKFDAMA